MKGRLRSTRGRARLRQVWIKAFVWVFIAIFLVGSVGAIALVAIR